MGTSSYIPAAPPAQLSPEARRFLDEELARIAACINQRAVYLPVLAAEPAKPEDGMLVYADGTNWNPSSGAGVYAREAGAWVKL